MRMLICSLSLGALLCPAVLSLAQTATPSVSTAGDVTLQLPTFNTFGANTSVIVPDRGTAALAGSAAANADRVWFSALPRDLTLNRAQAHTAARVGVQVHDPRAAEADLQREMRERRATWARNSVAPLGRSQRDTPDVLPGIGSVSDLERQRAARAAARAEEGVRYLELAREAHAAGKSGVAAVYYGMAANRATGKAKQAIEIEATRARDSQVARRESAPRR